MKQKQRGKGNPFKEGNPGRPPGPNKKTVVLDGFAKHIVEGGMDKFQDELNKLTGKDYVTAFMTIFEYVKPKLARTELTGKDGGPIKGNLSWIDDDSEQTESEATTGN